MPTFKSAPNSLVIERLQQPGPTVEVVACPDVIAGENLGASQTAQQDILGCPAADTSQGTKAFDRLFVTQLRQPFQIKTAFEDRTSKFSDRSFLLPAEA